MSDIIVNVTQGDIIANFSSDTSVVEVLLKQSNYTMEIVGPPEQISADIVNATNSVEVQTSPNIEVGINRDGASAYELALRNGFVGTETEWLDSLSAEQKSYSDLAEYDSVLSNYIYFGRSDFPIDTNLPIWQIYRLNINDVTISYADGDQLFDNIWDNRESLIYI